MKSGIYCIKCLLNNKIYVGSAINIAYRFTRHKNDLNKQKHHSIHLQRAWNLYGRKYFEFKILEFCLPNFLEKKEKEWIKFFKSDVRKFGFNILINGNSRLGLKHTLKTKKKISKNNASRGKFYEYSMRGSKPVYQYDLNGYFIKKWNSLKEPADQFKITHQNISKCILGERNIAGQFMWFKEFKGEKIESYSIKKPVIQLTIDDIYVKEYENISQITQQNPKFIVQCIWSVCNKKRKTAYGFKWKYKKDYESDKIRILD
jgi:group I intron endonuclease